MTPPSPSSLPPSFFIHYHSIIVLYIGIFSLLILVKCCRETIQIMCTPVSFQRQDSFNNSAFGQMLQISQTSVRCVQNERSCFLFSTSLLPPRTLSSPPPPWDGCFWWGRPMDKLIHHTDSAFGGKPHFGPVLQPSSFPAWPFHKNDSQFWQPRSYLTVSCFSHFRFVWHLFLLICLTFIQFTVMSDLKTKNVI